VCVCVCVCDLAFGLLKQTHQALLGSEDGVGGGQAAHVVIHRIQLPLLNTERRNHRDNKTEASSSLIIRFVASCKYAELLELGCLLLTKECISSLCDL